MIEAEYLEKELLEEYYSIIMIYVLSTFKLYTRAYNFTNLPYKERCLNCSKSFLFIKDKRRQRYCSNECRENFYSKFPTWENLRWEIAYRDQLFCQLCQKKVIFIKEKVTHQIIGSEKPYSEWTKEDFKEHKIVFVQEEVIFDIDHIKELSTFPDGYEQAKAFFDKTNLQLVCKPCHKIKTANFLSKRFNKHEKPELIIQTKVKSKKLIQFL